MRDQAYQIGIFRISFDLKEKKKYRITKNLGILYRGIRLRIEKIRLNEKPSTIIQ